ncbi:hypothetical protein DXG03_003811 [Asterophora parasitica]|uniref:Uncharacterized protein n=1 Tax=Asterophora parasitica TaxID=117018 RepID=A0A9P7G2Y8_9AGAR|nr:hypothetical protein DXG03_003811 [Asterophora parasitica]
MEPHPVSPELIPSDTEDTGASVRVPTDVSRSDPVPHVLHETYYIHDDMAVFLRVRQCAIEAIESNPLLPPIEKIQLAEKHDIPHWRRPAFEALCQRETPISIDEARMIGLENAMSLAQAREIVRERSLSTSSASEAEVWVSKPVPTGWGVAVPTEGAKKKSAPPVGPYNAQLVADVVREVFFPHRLPPPSSPLLGQV